ncbi:MAG TPA: hypothetical protein DCS66_15805 [Flavobacteriaceae bacterium]|nr:hypothetical protein [Flavobacteriaceae bacterium]HAT66036.1 hypothetical protein [Flavobacteriaceae bacterium]|tara:strand:- start:122506 stop:122835 length:330 start_codon:yes stop_codon:yes gene_type:complete
MGKIEEITELLVNEISSFEKSIERLEKVSEKLHSTKISIDIKEYKLVLESHQKQIKAILDSQERILNRYEELLKDAKIYPNWAVIVFIVSLLSGIASTTFVLLAKIWVA